MADAVMHTHPQRTADAKHRVINNSRMPNLGTFGQVVIMRVTARQKVVQVQYIKIIRHDDDANNNKCMHSD